MARRLRLDRQRQRQMAGLVLVSPWLVGLVLFKLAPILASLWLSLTNFYLLAPEAVQFVGLRNYAAMLNEPATWEVLRRTALLALWMVPVQLAAALALAAALSSRHLRQRSLLRTLFSCPASSPAWQPDICSRAFSTRVAAGSTA